MAKDNIVVTQLKRLLKLILRALVLMAYLFARLGVVIFEALANLFKSILATK